MALSVWPRACPFATCLFVTAAAAVAQDSGNEPLTVAEASKFERTSTYADVIAFLDKLRKLPHAGRLRRATIGDSVEGRALPLVAVAEPPLPPGNLAAAVHGSGKLRLLVNANIHAGEVEGKEAVLILLRELAQGKHAELLESSVLLFVPIYNADGNDRISVNNRSSQNGPVRGVGLRPNIEGYDLNRDFIKADSPESRALLGVFRDYDPHLFMDLHTTNGSTHGYHLTYAPSLATNVDPAIDAFTRKELLAFVRAEMKGTHGFRVYDYGNFGRRRTGRRWATYDHRPRFGTNYFGLRNRVGVLSEAYSYLPFEKRVRVTRAFVLETLRYCHLSSGTLGRLCAQADARARTGTLELGYASRLEDAWEGEILVGRVKRERLPNGRSRVIAEDFFEAQKMPVQTAFVATERIRYPRSWAILGASDKVVFALLDHDLEVGQLAARTAVQGARFAISDVVKSRRPFQKHREVRLEGAWKPQRVELPAGTIVVSAKQRLARVAAQLLEAYSEDSLTTWNYFDDELELLQEYPVVRVLESRAWKLQEVRSETVRGKRRRVVRSRGVYWR